MVENIVNVRLGIGVASLPNGREHSQCHGWTLVCHFPMVENIVNVMGGHWCIIAQW